MSLENFNNGLVKTDLENWPDEVPTIVLRNNRWEILSAVVDTPDEYEESELFEGREVMPFKDTRPGTIAAHVADIKELAKELIRARKVQHTQAILRSTEISELNKEIESLREQLAANYRTVKLVSNTQTNTHREVI